MCESPENLTCVICVELYQDPVKLPCQHTYCRECIRTHAERSRPQETDDTSETSRMPQNDWLIQCPLCRKEASLGEDGVDGLPDNIYLADIAERSRSRRTVEEGACAETPENATDHELCITHEVALIMYCESCSKLLCLECLEEHGRHPMSSKKSVYKNLKEPIQTKAYQCKVSKDDLARLVSELDDLKKEIRKNKDSHKAEIEQAYREGLEVLNSWRRDAMNRIENRHAPLTNQAKTILTELSPKMAEIEQMIQKAENLPTSLTKDFLQMSGDLTARMDVHLSNGTDFIENQRKAKKTVEETLRLDPAVPLNLDVKLNVAPLKERGASREPRSYSETKRRACSSESDVFRSETEPWIELPCLKFVKTSDPSLMITAQGSGVSIQNGPPKWCEAWSDGCFRRQCHLWTIQIFLEPTSLEPKVPRCIFTAGVRHQDSTLNGKAGLQCWWVGISKLEEKCQVYSECGKVTERFRKWVPFRETYTFEFQLWCEMRRLTVKDWGEKAVILTVDNVDVSKPLVPAVDFHGDFLKLASARLVTGTCD